MLNINDIKDRESTNYYLVINGSIFVEWFKTFPMKIATTSFASISTFRISIFAMITDLISFRIINSVRKVLSSSKV